MVKTLGKHPLSSIDLEALTCVHQEALKAENELIKSCVKDIIDAIKIARSSGYEHLWIINSYDLDILAKAKALIQWEQVIIKVEFYSIQERAIANINANRMFVPVLVADIG